MKTIKLKITPELEQQLRAEAAKQSLEPACYIVNTLQEHLRYVPPDTPHLSQIESALLQNVNLGLSSEIWEQYHELIAKRRAETLTSAEYKTLIELSDHIEQLNVKRMQSLVELAKLRNTSLDNVMQDLGIEFPSYV